MSTKHKKVCMTLNYFELLLVLASEVTGCVTIFTFAYLIGIPNGIQNYAVGLKFWAIIAGIIKYKLKIKKMAKKHDRIVL